MAEVDLLKVKPRTANWFDRVGQREHCPMRVRTIILIAFVASAVAIGVALLPVTGAKFSGVIEQPIAFSHALHAGRNEISCLYCHRQADRSEVAGIPSVKTCLGCHQGLKGSAGQVPQLKQAWRKQQPIRWVKVNDLPDHVRFSHERHVRVAVSCQNCHGPVETMEHVEPIRKLTMGWCLSCHRQARVATTATGEARAVLPGASPHGLADFIAQQNGERRPSIDCAVCHK